MCEAREEKGIPKKSGAFYARQWASHDAGLFRTLDTELDTTDKTIRWTLRVSRPVSSVKHALGFCLRFDTADQL